MRRIHFVIFGAVLLLVFFAVGILFFGRTTGSGVYSTKLTYPDNVLDTLPRSSSLAISFDDIARIDRELFRIVSRFELSETEAVRLYTHVALVQHDFLQLSQGKTGAYSGSIIPITKKLICKEIVQACSELGLHLTDASSFTDEYTIALTESVYSVFLMHEAEHAIYTTFNHINESSLFGASEEVRSAEVPVIQEIVATRTDDKLRAAIFWDGTTGSKRSAGIWLSILDEYLTGLMGEHTQSEVVSIRTSALMAAHDAYMQALAMGKRTPYATLQSLQPSLVPVLPLEVDDVAPVPDVAFITALSSILLPYLQGETRDFFIEERDEAIASRLWSGAYLPSDVSVAERIGEEVAGTYTK